MWFSRLWIPSCFYLLVSLACTPTPQDSATLILTGDRLWTGNPEQPWAEAIAVREDRPLAVDSREELSRYQGAYTTNNAWAAGEGSLKGSLEPGKLADLVVLSDDPFTLEPSRLKDVRVLLTMVGGDIVHQRD